MSMKKCFIYDQLEDEVIKLLVLQIEFFTAENSSVITVCFTYSNIAYSCMDDGKHHHSTSIVDSQTNIDISIAEVNIVMNRPTRSVKCISSGYNNWIKDNMIDYIGCIPPFWDGFTDKKCTVKNVKLLGKDLSITQFLTYNTSNC